MQVDEKGLQTAVDEFRMVHASNGGNLHASLRRAITTYLSARSAEPVASEIGEEEIARALVEFQFPGCGEDEATVASHLPMARAVLALLHPALERARVAGLEAAAQYLEACDDYGDRHKAAEVRAIRKG